MLHLIKMFGNCCREPKKLKHHLGPELEYIKKLPVIKKEVLNTTFVIPNSHLKKSSFV